VNCKFFSIQLSEALTSENSSLIFSLFVTGTESLDFRGV
jgi:hypothetical protein